MGQKDLPLTIRGKRQAEELKNIFHSTSFDAVYSSDLLRTVKTAEIITAEKQLAIKTSQLLRERSYGRFEGRPAIKYRENIKHLLDELKQLSDAEKPAFKFADDVESDLELASRFIRFLREIAVIHPKETVLVSSHGGCIRTFLVHIGYASYHELPSGSCANGSYIKILSDGLDFIVKEAVGIKITKPS
ncbi:hypothetical protein A2936_00355 [Candidatus Uhrbacteria bacterium RIFCSPLOWO2_01_FULL_47_25]|uniref:Histidine phosphatase family protein n=1 Tax=Candidatus Uhrbacteria bacterium RIFCSPLOWO2_01_FULL_47_25 TaxID=1802402 RepID=A0A1F7US10_9BACT|nr:MAG: hypothetical protein A2936_00355 [Candidatus Uhrbacteria bacterium RIFCSPLOWO2_01_FULL_47_25]